MCFTPVGDVPVIHSGSAPIIVIPRLLAADIFIVTGIRLCLLRPSCGSKSLAAKHDCHPVSAVAEYEAVFVADAIVDLIPRSSMSDGTATAVMLTQGCGSDCRFCQVLFRSL